MHIGEAIVAGERQCRHLGHALRAGPIIASSRRNVQNLVDQTIVEVARELVHEKGALATGGRTNGAFGMEQGHAHTPGGQGFGAVLYPALY